MWSVSERTGTSNSKSAVLSTSSAGGALKVVQVNLHRARDRLCDDLDQAPGRVVLDLDQGSIARAEELSVRPVVGPILEPEAVGLAPSCAEERDQLVHLRRLS
jgi:hypothetical protein